MTRGDGTSASAVRAAYPFTGRPSGALVHWACLLACGHTVEVDLEPGTRPRATRCPRCGARGGPPPPGAPRQTSAVPAPAVTGPDPASSEPISAAPAASRQVASPPAAEPRRARRPRRSDGELDARGAADPRQLGFWFDLDR